MISGILPQANLVKIWKISFLVWWIFSLKQKIHKKKKVNKQSFGNPHQWSLHLEKSNLAWDKTLNWHFFQLFLFFTVAYTNNHHATNGQPLP